ncbi:MAG: magnesium transporter [Candidatus Aenigmatarchaeota archaeon]
MKQRLLRKLEVLRKKERRKYHPLTHKIHREHRISKKTLFYVKEYGPHSNVFGTIVKESIKVLLLASVLSSFGGLALEQIRPLFLSLMPLVVLLPALNDMLGDYGTIISSRYSTMLHEGKISGNTWGNAELRKLLIQIFVVAICLGAISVAVALVVSMLSGYGVTAMLALKVMVITLADIALFVSSAFMVSITLGRYFYRKGEDPDNFLIPVTTSMADFGNMFVLLLLIMLLF